MTEEARAFVERPGLERPQLHGAVHRRLRLSGRRPGGASTAWRRRAKEFDRDAVSGGIGAGRHSGTGPVPRPHGQARGFVSDRARAFCAGAVSLPARARSAGRREHEPAAGHRGEAADQSRSHVRARHQSELRHLPQTDRSDRLRSGEIRRASAPSATNSRCSSPPARRGRREAGARRRRRWISISTPPGMSPAFPIRSSRRLRNWAPCWRRARNARNAW